MGGININPWPVSHVSRSSPSCGRSATSSGGASCSARRQAGPRWPARACSTTTGTRRCSASASQACVSYDCAWAFELGYVVRDALRRMYEATPEHPDGENIFYYLTIYNEPYPQPPEPVPTGGPAELEEGILRGLYRYAPFRGIPNGRGVPGRGPRSWPPG